MTPTTWIQPLYPASPYPEPWPSTVVSWRAAMSGQSYTYVAVHIAGVGWFLTGQITHPLSWDALCYHLPPEDGRFLVLGVVGQLTAQLPARLPAQLPHQPFAPIGAQ